jgi:phosphoribulokinase
MVVVMVLVRRRESYLSTILSLYTNHHKPSDATVRDSDKSRALISKKLPSMDTILNVIADNNAKDIAFKTAAEMI